MEPLLILSLVATSLGGALALGALFHHFVVVKGVDGGAGSRRRDRVGDRVGASSRDTSSSSSSGVVRATRRSRGARASAALSAALEESTRELQRSRAIRGASAYEFCNFDDVERGRGASA